MSKFFPFSGCNQTRVSLPMTSHELLTSWTFFLHLGFRGAHIQHCTYLIGIVVRFMLAFFHVNRWKVQGTCTPHTFVSIRPAITSQSLKLTQSVTRWRWKSLSNTMKAAWVQRAKAWGGVFTLRIQRIKRPQRLLSARECSLRLTIAGGNAAKPGFAKAWIRNMGRHFCENSERKMCENRSLSFIGVAA